MTEEIYLAKIQGLQDQLDRQEKDKVEASKRVTLMAAQKEKRLDELHGELIRQKESGQQMVRETLQNHSREMEEMQQQTDKLNAVKALQAAGIEEGDKKLMELKQQKFRVELLEKEVLLAEAEFHKISEEEKSLKKKYLENLQERLEKKVERDAAIFFDELNARIEKRGEFCKFLSKEAEEQAQEVAGLKDKIADILAIRTDVRAESSIIAEEKSSLIKDTMQTKVSCQRRSAPPSLLHWTAEPDTVSASAMSILAQPPEE
ncbi:probable inactive protein kinase DDB_G0270444 isoform X2 [Oryzias latipes]|uniref:probable inactive protein kinase DDB_G0270444 isoform X2 n=1 Tax=Oryzias latipes TaxID=8090 RepID=UPI0002A48859|nr:probable inactive protein kinase DDB_G0270444 isoform X2 [Oryzias latipes]